MFTSVLLFISLLFSAPSDFNDSPLTLIFSPGDTTQLALIPIIDDTVIENPELFNLLLTSSDPSAVTSGSNSSVIIVEDYRNDSKSLVFVIIT